MSYNELMTLIDACVNRNGVHAITGRILNGVLKAMVQQLGAGFTLGGMVSPTDDPGTPDAPICYFASEVGTYTNFGGLTIAPGEFALFCYDLTDGWYKETIYEGFQSVQANVDDQVGTPEVDVTYNNGVLAFDFRNMKGNTGDPAGFGAITATVDDQIGTPAVSVTSSGPDTAKVISFAFRNLKGETGVTSAVVTVDNTIGTPSCAVSLVGQELHLDFTGLKGAQGDTGVSADYPIAIVNNLTTNDPAQALSAAMGVQLESEISQLEHKVDDFVRRNEDEDIDFAIQDGNDKAIAIFSNGEIGTKNFNSGKTTQSIETLEEDGDLNFVDTNLNSVLQVIGGHIRTKNFDSRNIQDTKKPYSSAWERFKVTINRTPVGKFYNTHTNATDTAEPAVESKEVTGVIALPTTYTPSGKPTRLICFCHGTTGNVTDSEWYNNNSLMINHFVPFWLSQGYAVFDCNGVADGMDRYQGNRSAPCGLPDTMQAYINCYEYIVEKYNVYPQIYLWGCSDGGPVPLNWLFIRPGTVAAIAECDAVIDLKQDAWDGAFSYKELRRQNIAERLGFSDLTGNTYENDVADIWNPFARIKEIGDKKFAFGFNVPIFIASTASESYFTSETFHIREEFAEAIINGGTVCLSKWYDTLTHDDVAMGGSNTVLDDVLKWFNRF